MKLVFLICTLAAFNCYASDSIQLNSISSEKIAENKVEPSVDDLYKELGLSPEDLEKEQEKINKNLKEKGYTEVDNSQIINLDHIISRYSKYLKKDMNDVINQLSYKPSYSLNNQNNFKLLAVEAAGALTEKGYSDLSMIYDSPYGKVQITESDLVANKGKTFLPASAFNEKIGLYDAYFLVEKGKDRDEKGRDIYQTTIYWNNPEQKKDYNVLLNKNLNDPIAKKEKEHLLQELGAVYGGVQ